MTILTTDELIALHPDYVPRSYLPARHRARMVPPRDAMPEPALKQAALVYSHEGGRPHLYHDVELIDSSFGHGFTGFWDPSRDARGLHVFHGDPWSAVHGCTAALWSGWVTGDEPVLLGGREE